MRSLLVSVSLMFVVACAKPVPTNPEHPPATPSPVEDVVVEKIEEIGEKNDMRIGAKERARKLLEIILGGVNR